MKKSLFRGRFAGRLYFGKTKNERWSITDPDSEKLNVALHEMRYGNPTRTQIYLVIGAAEDYRHLFTYPLRGIARNQFSDICRAVKVPSDENWKPSDEEKD